MTVQTLVERPQQLQPKEPPKEPFVIVLREPERKEEQAQGFWLKTACGVALLAAALYGASRFGAFDSIPTAYGVRDWATELVDSTLFKVGKYAGAIYFTKEVATTAGPKVAEGLVSAGGQAVSKSAQYFPTLVGLTANSLTKVGSFGFRLVTSLLPFGNKGQSGR